MEPRKTIILVGPNGHLGKEILLELLTKYYVIGISRNASKCEIPLKLNKYYSAFNHDLNNFKQDHLVNKVKTFLKDKNTKLQGIINNGYFGYPNRPDNINKSDVYLSAEGIFGVQIRIIISLEKLLTEGSSVINISSMYGKVAPNPQNYSNNDQINALLYGSMKAALIQGSRWLSATLGEKGIRVNSVSYGPFPQSNIQKSDPKFIKKLSQQTHLKRIGNANESTGIILFLLSDAASYITGTDISVDGGWTAW